MTLPNLTASQAVGPTRHTRLRLSRGRQGRPLPEVVRQKMEEYFHCDFSGVRIHLGRETQALNTDAFTIGNRIYMAPEHYNPNSEAGLILLATQLAHVKQQAQGRVSGARGRRVSVIRDLALEQEAQDEALKATAFLLGKTPATAEPSPTMNKVAAEQVPLHPEGEDKTAIPLEDKNPDSQPLLNTQPRDVAAETEDHDALDARDPEPSQPASAEDSH